MTPETLTLRDTAAILRRVCPLAGPVRVRFCDLSKRRLCGEAYVTHDGRRHIKIARGLSIDLIADTLIHEWAHLRAWERHGVKIPVHGADWGRSFAAVYSAWEAEATG